MGKEKSVLINLLAIARYEHAPDYPIQFMTKGTLHLGEKDDAIRDERRKTKGMNEERRQGVIGNTLTQLSEVDLGV